MIGCVPHSFQFVHQSQKIYDNPERYITYYHIGLNKKSIWTNVRIYLLVGVAVHQSGAACDRNQIVTDSCIWTLLAERGKIRISKEYNTFKISIAFTRQQKSNFNRVTQQHKSNFNREKTNQRLSISCTCWCTWSKGRIRSSRHWKRLHDIRLHDIRGIDRTILNGHT